MGKYWFPAKQFGWGWGLPEVWQGWAVLVVFFVLLTLGNWKILPRFGVLAYILYVAAMSALLVGVAYLTGEPPGRS